MLKKGKYLSDSAKSLTGHTSKLCNILTYDEISFDNYWLRILLDRLLGELNPVVDNEKRIIGPENLVIQRNTVQILLEN